MLKGKLKTVKAINDCQFHVLRQIPNSYLEENYFLIEEYIAKPCGQGIKKGDNVFYIKIKEET